MDIKVLRYFYEAARLKSISKAGEYLHVSQSNISRQIKLLEEELGQKLFIRSNYRIELTDEGLILQKRCEDILDLVDKTVSEFGAMRGTVSGNLHIGCAETPAFRCISQCIKTLREKYPSIHCHVNTYLVSDIISMLDKGRLDFGLAVVWPPNPNIYDMIKLPVEDTWGLIVPADTQIATHETLTRESLYDVPIFSSPRVASDLLPLWFGNAWRDLNIVGTYNLVGNASYLVRDGIGCLLALDGLIDTSPGSGLCFRPFSPKIPSPCYFFWRKDAVLTKEASLFLQEMRVLYGESEAENMK